MPHGYRQSNARLALQKLDELEASILHLGDHPDIGMITRYGVLKRQGYKVQVLEKKLVFCKMDNERKRMVTYAVVDRRQDYLNNIL